MTKTTGGGCCRFHGARTRRPAWPAFRVHGRTLREGAPALQDRDDAPGHAPRSAAASFNDGGSVRDIDGYNEPASPTPGDTQSESGNSKYSAYIMSRCSNRIGSSAASLCASRVSNAALVLASISHWSGGSGTNIAVKVAL